MKITNIFKKDKKEVKSSNIQKVDKKQLEKVVGGLDATTVSSTEDAERWQKSGIGHTVVVA